MVRPDLLPRHSVRHPSGLTSPVRSKPDGMGGIAHQGAGAQFTRENAALIGQLSAPWAGASDRALPGSDAFGFLRIFGRRFDDRLRCRFPLQRHWPWALSELTSRNVIVSVQAIGTYRRSIPVSFFFTSTSAVSPSGTKLSRFSPFCSSGCYVWCGFCLLHIRHHVGGWPSTHRGRVSLPGA